MRRRSVFVLAIMLVGFGAMLTAAGTALKPLARDAEASRILTHEFEARGDLVAGTRVRLSRLGVSEKRLAAEGRGIVIEVTPSRGPLERRGGLRLLALRLSRSALARFHGKRQDWVEIRVLADPANGLDEDLRTLLAVSGESQIHEPAPPLPRRPVSAGE